MKKTTLIEAMQELTQLITNCILECIDRKCPHYPIGPCPPECQLLQAMQQAIQTTYNQIAKREKAQHAPKTS